MGDWVCFYGGHIITWQVGRMLVTSLSVIGLLLTLRQFPWLLGTNPLLECGCYLELGYQTSLWTVEKGQTARVEEKLR